MGRFAAFCLAAIATVGLAWLVAAQRGPIHFATAGIEFDYPASWTVERPGHPGHYEDVMAYLGTGHADQTCGPDYFPGASSCSEHFYLQSGTVILRVSIWDGPPELPGQDRVTAILQSQPHASPAWIGGQPAALTSTSEQTLSGPEWALNYVVEAPSRALLAYQLEFLINRADLATMQPTIDELLRTIRITALN